MHLNLTFWDINWDILRQFGRPFDEFGAFILFPVISDHFQPSSAYGKKRVMDRRTDGRTDPLIEMRERIQKLTEISIRPIDNLVCSLFL